MESIIHLKEIGEQTLVSIRTLTLFHFILKFIFPLDFLTECYLSVMYSIFMLGNLFLATL